MRSHLLLWVVMVLVPVGCGHKAGDGDCPDGVCPADATLSCLDPAGVQCASDQICSPAGACITNACGTAHNPCAAGDTCSTTCVPSHDRCEGVVCGINTTCVDGQCVAGCFSPSPCLNTHCGPDEFCYYGACKPRIPCDADCSAGFMCQVACTPPSPCDGVTCEANEFCLEGQCITNLCFGVTCAPGEACNAGVCTSTCDCPGGCGPNGQCVFDVCQCVPDCTGKACGDDDGCGGECDLPCPQGGQFDCRDGGGGQLSCQCVGTCAGKACGADNGCGAECSGTCGAGDACVLQGPGNYECQCNPTCTNGAGQNCGDPNSCATGFCDIEDCTDTGETCNPSGNGFACVCPVGRAECSGDCCSNQTDSCRTETQVGTGTTGATTVPAACCNAGDNCTDPARNTVCCTGAGLACVDSDNDGDTESCCTVARQCNDTTAPNTNQACCGSGETCIDTTADPDTQKELCCANAQACSEIGTCCPTGEYCSTRPGAGNDMCCTNGTINCDGACVPKCNGGAPNRCNDGIAGNEVCCTGAQNFCDGTCVAKCAANETQYQCNDGTANNEVCCATAVQRCPGASNATAVGACCGIPEDTCFGGGAGPAPICCSDAASYCSDSGACCPDAQTCLADNDNNAANDLCCDPGQVIAAGVCCTPTCPDPATISCGTLDSCGSHECPGTCEVGSICAENPASGPLDYTCQPQTCTPPCNSGACYDCIGGVCDFRCDNPGIGGVCRNGQCVIQ